MQSTASQPAHDLAVYSAIKRNDQHAAFSEVEKIKSVDCAKQNVNALLRNSTAFFGDERLLLDKITVYLLSKLDVVNPSTGRVLVDDARLITWLDSAHCGTPGQCPLYGLIDLLIKFVSKGDHINRCLSSVITHLVQRVEIPANHLDGEYTNVRSNNVLCRLLKLGQTQEGNMARLLKFTDKCIYTRGLVRTVAELYPGSVCPNTEIALRSFESQRLQLFYFFRSPIREKTSAIEARLDLLRAWLEVGIALKLPESWARHFMQNPLHRVLCQMLVIRHCGNSAECVRCCIRLALWLARASPELSRLMFRLEADKVKQICARFPALAQTVLYPVRSLQQLCTSVIRHHLRLPLLVSVSSLPLPVSVKRYVASGFLDLDPFVVESIADEVQQRGKCELPKRGKHPVSFDVN